MSRIAFATPVTNSAPSATAGVTQNSDEHQREPPTRQGEDAHLPEVASATEPEGGARTHEPTEPDRGIQEAHAGIAHVEELDRCDDDQRDEQATHEDLRDEVADQDRRSRVLQEDARCVSESEASRPVDADPAPGVGGALEADAGHGSGRAGERGGNEQAGDDGSCRRDQQSGHERTDEGSDPLAGARGDVRGDELARGARESREERGLDRPYERPRAGHHGGEGVGELDR